MMKVEKKLMESGSISRTPLDSLDIEKWLFLEISFNRFFLDVLTVNRNRPRIMHLGFS